MLEVTETELKKRLAFIKLNALLLLHGPVIGLTALPV